MAKPAEESHPRPRDLTTRAPGAPTEPTSLGRSGKGGDTAFSQSHSRAPTGRGMGPLADGEGRRSHKIRKVNSLGWSTRKEGPCAWGIYLQGRFTGLDGLLARKVYVLGWFTRQEGLRAWMVHSMVRFTCLDGWPTGKVCVFTFKKGIHAQRKARHNGAPCEGHDLGEAIGHKGGDSPRLRNGSANYEEMEKQSTPRNNCKDSLLSLVNL